MVTKTLKKTYKAFLLKSLIEDYDKYIYEEISDTSYTNKSYKIKYNTVTINIDKKALFKKVTIYGNGSFDFLNQFNFIFDKNLKYAYRRMKSYIKNNEISTFEKNMLESLPLSESRRQKLQNLLDI